MKIAAAAISTALGESLAELVRIVAEQAQQEDIALYLVGGMVRDLLLARKNLDLDFVLEGDAIAFSHRLASLFGGRLRGHAPFGTAKWLLDSADKITLPSAHRPHHIDLAAARSESYAQPAALPTVARGDIKDDLQRRDFTINTLAIQLSPAAEMWRVLDFHGGLADLKRQWIRALHPRSFIDDPTRILRALRFSQRLDFVIEPRTAQWIQAALPMLGRITGERLQNEIALIWHEPRPEQIILKLKAIGALKNIHPAWRINSQLPLWFEGCREQTVPWTTATDDLPHLYWHIIMAGMTSADAQAICGRLGLASSLTRSITACANVIENAARLQDPALRPSQLTQFLENRPPAALQAAWLALMDAPDAQQTIANFMNLWRKQIPAINGHDLKKMGLPPGPRYKEILERLRSARIDGEIQSEAEERALLHQLLEDSDSSKS